MKFQLIDRLNADEIFLKNVKTGDESWVYARNFHISKQILVEVCVEYFCVMSMRGCGLWLNLCKRSHTSLEDPYKTLSLFCLLILRFG